MGLRGIHVFRPMLGYEVCLADLSHPEAQKWIQEHEDDYDAPIPWEAEWIKRLRWDEITALVNYLHQEGALKGLLKKEFAPSLAEKAIRSIVRLCELTVGECGRGGDE